MFKYSSFNERINPALVRSGAARHGTARTAKLILGGQGVTPQGAISAPGGIRTPSTIRNQTGNPLLDNSLIDSWIPLDNMGLHQLWRRIYLRDPIAGPAVDFWRELPWSDYTLTGIEDRSQLKVYEDCLNALKIQNWLPDISSEFLALGKVCIHFLWNADKGYWDDLIIHNPDHIEVAKSPVINAPIKVDLKPTDEHLNFVNSTDPRDVAARKELDPAVIRLLAANQPIPLDPKNTIYLPRKAFAYDTDGISIYSRIIYFVALERPLFTASILASRRRAGPVTQITAGNEEWEPTPEELDALATAWLEAEEDAVSAVFVTRNDVQVNRAVSSLQADMWKISDEYQFISDGKMKALGINEAFLSGDASYNTMESALSVLLERIRSHRALITNSIIRDKIFTEVAKANEFVKRSKAEIDHKVRNGSSKSIIEKVAKGTADEDEVLVIPTINWHKHLKPSSDESMVNLLAAAEEHGLPVTVRDWASATGIDLDTAMKQMDEDLGLRKKIAAYKQKVMEFGGGMPGAEGGEGGEGGEGLEGVPPPGGESGESPMQLPAEASLREGSLQTFAKNLPIWDKKGYCLDLHQNQLRDLLHQEDFRAVLSKSGTWKEVSAELRKREFSDRKAEVIGYVLYRKGLLFDYSVPEGLVAELAKRVNGSTKESFKILREIERLQTIRGAQVKLDKSKIGEIHRAESQIPGGKLLTGNGADSTERV